MVWACGEVVEAVNRRSKNLSFSERAERIDKYSQMDFQQVCLNCPPGLEKLHDKLEESGVASTFRRLQWGLILSAILVAIMGVSTVAIIVLNKRAQKSQDDLIRSYRLSWKIGIAAALAKVFLLIPLLAYGTFEFTVLLSNRFFPKLLLVIILGGLFALWKSGAILLKKVPMEFKEPLCREVTPEEAPELWQAVKEAAQRLQTTPPDRILIGMQLNFYVSELAVIHDSGRAEGKTLFLSYPLLKQLSADEILAIIGHELGHFIGEDTRMSREFYPLRLKVHATMVAMARSGWVGWPSFQFLNFFYMSFGQTERAASRSRELLADQKAALLTSPTDCRASALVRFQVSLEAFKRGLADSPKSNLQSPFDIPLQTVVQEKLASDNAFWTQLSSRKNCRIPWTLIHQVAGASGIACSKISVCRSSQDDCRVSAEYQTAYAKWFFRPGRLVHESRAAGGSDDRQKMRTRTQVAQARLQNHGRQGIAGKTLPGEKMALKILRLLDRHHPVGPVGCRLFGGESSSSRTARRNLFLAFLRRDWDSVLAMVWKRHRQA